MVGITKLIHTVFAPQWRFKRLTHRPKNPHGLKRRAACKRGKQLDKECKINTQIKSKEGKLLQSAFANWGWTILHTQVLVRFENLHTFIDLIVRDSFNQEWIIEIKRGYVYKKCAVGWLKHQSKAVPDAALYQHQMQVLIGKWLWEKNHEGKTIRHALIYVNESQVEKWNDVQFRAILSEQGKVAILKSADQWLKRRKKKQSS